MARHRDWHCRGGRQICGRGIDACGRNGSDGRVSSGNAAHAPANGRVRGVGHSGRKRHLVAEHDGTAQRRHAHGDGRWWWWRGDCSSSAAAKGPRAHCEKSQEADSRSSKIFSDPLRKGPHAPAESRRRASEIAKGLRVRDWWKEKINLWLEPVQNERLAVFQITFFSISFLREWIRRACFEPDLFQLGLQS